MKESIGYSVSLNIVITFIIIVFAFLSAAIVYFRTNKANNVLIDTIQKYEGYNKKAKDIIELKLLSLGYGSRAINCSSTLEGKSPFFSNTETTCHFTDPDGSTYNNNKGYCVYKCVDAGKSDYYYYKVRINMMIGIPIIGDWLDIPIYSNTDRMYDFTRLFGE